MLNVYNITELYPPYEPQGNGVAETMVKDIKKALADLINQTMLDGLKSRMVNGQLLGTLCTSCCLSCSSLRLVPEKMCRLKLYW